MEAAGVFQVRGSGTWPGMAGAIEFKELDEDPGSWAGGHRPSPCPLASHLLPIRAQPSDRFRSSFTWLSDSGTRRAPRIAVEIPPHGDNLKPVALLVGCGYRERKHVGLIHLCVLSSWPYVRHVGGLQEMHCVNGWTNGCLDIRLLVLYSICLTWCLADCRYISNE